MKKIVSVALILGAMYSTANAIESRPYLGLEGSFSTTKISNDYITTGYYALEDSNDAFNFGINAGYQFDVNDKFYFNTELYLNTGKLFDEDKANHYNIASGNNGNEDLEVKLNQFFGFRIGAGYNFNTKISGFVFIGLNYNSYESQYNERDGSGMYFRTEYDETFLSPSFGLGVSYNFTKNLQAKLSYEFSKFTAEDKGLGMYQAYWGETYIDKDVDITVNTFRLSVNYLF